MCAYIAQVIAPTFFALLCALSLPVYGFKRYSRPSNNLLPAYESMLQYEEQPQVATLHYVNDNNNPLLRKDYGRWVRVYRSPNYHTEHKPAAYYYDERWKTDPLEEEENERRIVYSDRFGGQRERDAVDYDDGDGAFYSIVHETYKPGIQDARQEKILPLQYYYNYVANAGQNEWNNVRNSDFVDSIGHDKDENDLKTLSNRHHSQTMDNKDDERDNILIRTSDIRKHWNEKRRLVQQNYGDVVLHPLNVLALELTETLETETTTAATVPNTTTPTSSTSLLDTILGLLKLKSDKKPQGQKEVMMLQPAAPIRKSQATSPIVTLLTPPNQEPLKTERPTDATKSKDEVLEQQLDKLKQDSQI